MGGIAVFVRLLPMLLLVLSAAVHADNPPQTEDTRLAEATVNTFHSLCVRPLDHLDKVRAAMDRKAPAIAPENARPYLREQQGRAWYIPYNRFTHFVLTISDDNRICSLRGYHGDPAAAQALFDTLMRQPPKAGMQLEKLGPEQEDRDTGTLKLTAYLWEGGHDRYAFLLHVFTDSKDPALPRFFLVAETAPPITGD